MDKFTLYNDDCLNVLKTMEDNSIDSCVTDPPYGLSFMGKAWDYDVPKKEIWQEVFRVLKPGGHVLAFFGSRTYHRGVVQIEDAGFEIRDQIMWLYGSGFPKSHNIGKAIDAAAGATRKVVGTYKARGFSEVSPTNDGRNQWAAGKVVDKQANITEPATEEAKQWEGWGTALKPAHEPFVVARKPFKTSVAKNVLEYGTGAINIDGCRVELNGDYKSKPNGRPSQTGLSDNYDPENANIPDDKGRWPANVIHDGSDEVVSGFPESNSARIGNSNNPKRGGNSTPIWGMSDGRETNDYRDSGSAARFFYCAKASKSDKDEGLACFLAKKVVSFQTGGGASGKPSSLSAGRNTEYKNIHPTVKPTELMKYLCRLVTPKGGIVLDPFMGSGSTGKAALQEGFRFCGIEMSSEYFEIAKARIEHAANDKTVNLEEFFS